VHTHLAIEDALDFHEKLGIKRKQARLKHLTRYWTGQLRDVDRVRVNTPADENRYNAIANVAIDGLSPNELSKTLLEDYGIWTVAINHPNVKGIRVTPNVYTLTSELDMLVRALKDLSSL
jgi:selenocysteine lyase/cysteine desulfurase